GGWPTTVFLTPDGDVITGGTFVPVDRMAGVLRRVASALPTTHVPLEAAREARGPAEAEPEFERGEGRRQADLLDSIFSSFDEEHGGFGIEPKFPHTAPLHLAMALFRETGDDRWRTIVERTLDAMADGGLWDARGGGFYRYSTGRDW